MRSERIVSTPLSSRALRSRAAALAACAALAGCVTINIYFPAAAAEKAADKIIDEVWQIQNGGAARPAAPPAAGEKK
jgi:hypothetical protein